MARGMTLGVGVDEARVPKSVAGSGSLGTTVADPTDDELIAACQVVGLHLLDRLESVCRDHGLAFHLGGGTLLGAIRGGGFIPWDDDVDVTMPRADFERLRAAASGDPGIFGESITFDVGEDRIGRLRYLASESPAGPLALDVFALDPVPTGRLARGVSVRAWWALRTALSVSWGESPPPQRKAVIGSLARGAARMVGRRRLNAALDRLQTWMARRSDGSLWNCVVGSRPMGRERPSAWYAGGRTAVFEGREWPVPEDAEMILALVYGPDYMTPRHTPPQHVRRPLVVTLGDRHWDLP